jgi:glutamine amidotransferase
MDYLGKDSVITADYSEIIRAERIIFPGVGAAGRAMADLRKRKLDQAIVEAFDDKKPILGICLGTQVIMEMSEENDTECLGIIRGRVSKFAAGSSGMKVPHMGWNNVILKRKHPLFQGVEQGSEFYFVHSYYPVPEEPDKVLGETDYITRFASFLASGNLAAMQFHPEKSGEPGLKILANFSKWDGRDYVE